ncbi:MAG: lipoprotein signal peptidase [Bacteroidia bacterium]|nr:lipoprotein signal peptidase [Bacteroidia bacterium]
MKKPLLIVFLVLLVDQAIKFYVKTHFFLGEEFHVAGNWFIIHFTENNGMAFGMEFAGNYGKLFLTSFRILAVFAIVWYLYDLVRQQAPFGLIISISLILAGALGNIIDSVFYGVLFGDSNYEVAKFMPPEGGYAGLMHGKVVDMFYFPIVEGHFPTWFPIWGTEEFIFFRPVFNFSDSSITVGVLMILLFQRQFFPKKPANTDVQETESTINPAT